MNHKEVEQAKRLLKPHIESSSYETMPDGTIQYLSVRFKGGHLRIKVFYSLLAVKAFVQGMEEVTGNEKA